MPRFTVTIDIEVQFTSGKFASTDAIAEAIATEMESGVQLDSLSVDEGEYEVVDMSVDVEHVKPVRVRRSRKSTPKGNSPRAGHAVKSSGRSDDTAALIRDAEARGFHIPTAEEREAAIARDVLAQGPPICAVCNEPIPPFGSRAFHDAETMHLGCLGKWAER